MVVFKCGKFRYTKLKKLSSPEGTAIVQYTCTYLFKENGKKKAASAVLLGSQHCLRVTAKTGAAMWKNWVYSWVAVRQGGTALHVFTCSDETQLKKCLENFLFLHSPT